jgi:hypothetical protein
MKHAQTRLVKSMLGGMGCNALKMKLFGNETDRIKQLNQLD